MRRTIISHIVFPRPDRVRPVPEFVWSAIEALSGTGDLDVEVLMPVPSRRLATVHHAYRQARGRATWTQEAEAELGRLEPKPTLIRYVPLPWRSTESATAALAAAMLKRPSASRPALVQGSFLDESGFAATRVARVVGCPSVVVTHGTDLRVARGMADPGHARKKRAQSALEAATRVLAVCHELAQEVALLGRRAEVLPFTAWASHFSATPLPPGPPNVLFVGRICREKGVDVLLEAFAKSRHTEATLSFVGQVRGDVDVAARARALGIPDRVTMHGQLPQASLPPLYAASTCLALPSYSEGLPCVAVESLLSGRPVVATDVGGLHEFVDARVGALVPKGDARALTDALDQVLEKARARLFDPAELRKRALPMAWENAGPRLAELTRSLLRTR